jgi:hypothetical protein
MIRYPYIHNMNSRTYLNVTNVSLDYCQATHALEPCFRCKEFGSDDKATTLKKCALCLKVCHEECSRCVCVKQHRSACHARFAESPYLDRLRTTHTCCIANCAANFSCRWSGLDDGAWLRLQKRRFEI